MDPKTHLTKIYHVQTSPIPADETLKKLSSGIMLEGKKTMPAKFELIRSGEKNGWIEVHLQEGRNRQIRKMLESENIEVRRLIRIQIGSIQLNDLGKGEWRELTTAELQSCKLV